MSLGTRQPVQGVLDRKRRRGTIGSLQKAQVSVHGQDREGRDVFLADSNYVLQMAQNDFEHIKFHFTSEF